MEPDKISRRGFLKTFFGGIGALALGSKLKAGNDLAGFTSGELNLIRISETLISLDFLRILGKLPEGEYEFKLVGKYLNGSEYNSELSINGLILKEKKKYRSQNNMFYLPIFSDAFLENNYLGKLKYSLSSNWLPRGAVLETSDDDLEREYRSNVSFGVGISNGYTLGKVIMTGVRFDSYRQMHPPANISGKVVIQK